MLFFDGLWLAAADIRLGVADHGLHEVRIQLLLATKRYLRNFHLPEEMMTNWSELVGRRVPQLKTQVLNGRSWSEELWHGVGAGVRLEVADCGVVDARVGLLVSAKQYLLKLLIWPRRGNVRNWSELAGEMVLRKRLQVFVADYGLYAELDVELWGPVAVALATSGAVHGGPNVLRASGETGTRLRGCGGPRNGCGGIGWSACPAEFAPPVRGARERGQHLSQRVG